MLAKLVNAQTYKHAEIVVLVIYMTHHATRSKMNNYRLEEKYIIPNTN